MRILFGVNSFDNAGAENFMLRLAAHFQSKGHTIALFSLNTIRKEHYNRINDLFGPSTNLVTILEQYTPNKNKDKWLWRLNGIALKLGIQNWRSNYILKKTKRQIKVFNPEIINTHLFETDAFFAKLNIASHVISMHGPYEYYLHKISNDDGHFLEVNTNAKKINESFIENAKDVLNRSKNIIYCADKNLEIFNYVSIPGLRKEKIYYGYTPKPAKDNKKLKFTIGMFARGVGSKGWEILIESYLRLKPIFQDLHLKLIYNETEYMRSLELKYNSTDITFHGYESNIENQINSFDLIVFPTYYPGESLPNTIIESLMYGIPVISSNHAEIPNMLTLNGKVAGTIIEIKNLSFEHQVENCSNAIEKYLTDKQFYEVHRSNCAIVADQFSMETSYKRYLSFFESL